MFSLYCGRSDGPETSSNTNHLYDCASDLSSQSTLCSAFYRVQASSKNISAQNMWAVWLIISLLSIFLENISLQSLKLSVLGVSECPPSLGRRGRVGGVESLGQCWSEWRRWRTLRSSSWPGAGLLRLRRTDSRQGGGRAATQVREIIMRYISLMSHMLKIFERSD